MMLRGILFLLFITTCFFSKGKELHGLPRRRILILLNASLSMSEPWGKQLTRFQAASMLIGQLVDSVYKIDRQIEFGLRVYGHQYPTQESNCFDSRLEVMFSRDNRAQMRLRLQNIRPMGLSTVAFALNEVLTKDIESSSNIDYNVIAITDSKESCSKGFCPQAKLLMEKMKREVTVVSLVDKKLLGNEYDCLGQIYAVTRDEEVTALIDKVMAGYRALPEMLSVATPTQITNELQRAVDVPKIAESNSHKTNANSVSKLGKNGRITFEYIGNAQRKMTEFNAILRRNIEYYPEIHVKCTNVAKCPPGSYNVEIVGSLPPIRKTVVVEAGELSHVSIPEAGFVKFKNTGTEIVFYYNLQGRYIEFYRTADLDKLATRSLRLMPGSYRVSFHDKLTFGLGENKILPFDIKSNEVTEVKIE